MSILAGIIPPFLFDKNTANLSSQTKKHCTGLANGNDGWVEDVCLELECIHRFFLDEFQRKHHYHLLDDEHKLNFYLHQEHEVYFLDRDFDHEFEL